MVHIWSAQDQPSGCELGVGTTLFTGELRSTVHVRMTARHSRSTHGLLDPAAVWDDGRE